jgi:hypothetical protein
MDNVKLISSVESVLGKGKKTSNGNVAHFCPFCNHHKRKLEIQMIINSKGENPWNCWVCQKKGKRGENQLLRNRFESGIGCWIPTPSPTPA